jgi:hypothetical protein
MMTHTQHEQQPQPLLSPLFFLVACLLQRRQLLEAVMK